MTLYFAVIATAAFVVQCIRTYIAWREWRLSRGWMERKYNKEQKRKEV